MRNLDARSENAMHIRTKSLAVISSFALATIVGAAEVHAQTSGQRIALKDGESVELGNVYWVANCRSIMVGIPEIEILEGPREVTLAVKEGMVLPRRQNCASKVPGGTIVATAKDVKEPSEAKLTYRLKYKTKDGERQTSNVYNFSLFP
jgi:hypothetical protein